MQGLTVERCPGLDTRIFARGLSRLVPAHAAAASEKRTAAGLGGLRLMAMFPPRWRNGGYAPKPHPAPKDNFESDQGAGNIVVSPCGSIAGSERACDTTNVNARSLRRTETLSKRR